ncbi:OLC1v1013270C1 [Oldenlandia corymbosa var. corymbosa]|uniref:High-affinity nitrate transporter n=1 Tax=Oldenlandia corymbosa var. corymbosa TaxID=529605 RepID=A0AAV1DXW2_OLDCO|nr:OLC1v1013270C1 [Oldenlandia corymbosa var. corymbosa]
MAAGVGVPIPLVVAFLLVSFFAASCHGGVSFKSLQSKRTLIVKADPKPGQVLKAGEDKITVAWSFDQSFPNGTDSAYKTVKVKLCYAPVSQKDRAWRKTVDDLEKDKTCQFKIVAKPYNPSNNTFTWSVERSIPGAFYFVRAYAFNSAEEQVGFGQTVDDPKGNNQPFFEIDAITGRHLSLDIAAVCFSAFSVLSLFGFFVAEKRKAKAHQQK